jgi:hypothetical protein
MTLTKLFDQVAAQQALRQSRVKDVKTSLRYLARALGADGPEQCAADILQAPGWKARLNRYLETLQPPPSGHTVRNTRNNLSWLARQAQALGLLNAPAAPAVAAPPTRVQQRRRWRQQARFPRLYAAGTPDGRYSLPRAQWPPAIRAWWEACCTARALEVRATTFTTYERYLRAYVGFLLAYDPPPVATADDLLSVARLDRFVRWQAQRWGVRVTWSGLQTAKPLRNLANYTHSPAAAALIAYCARLPEADPVHDKARHWFTLAELEQVGLDLWAEARRPVASRRAGTGRPIQRPGLYRALQCGRALMLRLLVRVPLRQRNLREMRLEKHLYRDGQGHWHLAFAGEDLKVGRRRGRPNSFRLDLSAYAPELISHLEDYLTRARPRLPRAEADPHVWLTKGGRPYAEGTVYAELRAAVDRRLGRHFYPHLIRTIWATEFINATGDFTTAAYMLNDSVQTVLRRYQALLDRDLQAKAQAFLRQALPPATPPRPRGHPPA